MYDVVTTMVITLTLAIRIFKRTFDVWSIDYFCEIFTKIANRIHIIHQIFIFYFQFKVEMSKLRKLDLFVLSCYFVRLIFSLCILMRCKLVALHSIFCSTEYYSQQYAYILCFNLLSRSIWAHSFVRKTKPSIWTIRCRRLKFI